MRRIIIPVLLIAVVAGAIYYYRRAERRKAPQNTLMLSGNIEAHESVVGFRTQGRIVELPVEEGRAVKAGDLLARLDDSDYKQQVRIDEASVHTRGAELELALAGSRTQEVRAAEQVVADAKADLELKRADFERYSELYKKDVISAQARDATETALKRARASVEHAEQNLSEIREGTRKEQIAVSRASVNSAEQNLQMSEVRLGYTTLRAPVSGVVTVRQAELGEYVSPGTPVVTIADLDHLWLRAYVAETDLGHVRLGQAVTVKTDSLSSKSYRGTISFISPQAEFTPKSVETHKERVALVYRVKIEVENPNQELKPGMPADATIEFGK